MAIVSGTMTTYDAKGIREDLSDVIYNISPTDTPFLTMAKRGKASATLFDWQQDSLASPDANNAVVEGDEASFSTPAATVRLGNHTQISRKTAIVSGTQESVDKAGRKNEMAYQMAKRSKELKRDMETILLSNQAAVAGNTSTARKTGSILAFIKTNTSVGASPGANPSYTTLPNATRTDGVQRAYTEALLKIVLQAVWTSGGDPKIVMTGPVNKGKASAFAGIAQIRKEAPGQKQATIVGAADIYVSDFGNVTFVPNRFMRERDALVLDPEYLEVSYLRPFNTQALAKTGDAEKKMILAEYGLRVGNEAAHGIVADLTTT